LLRNGMSGERSKKKRESNKTKGSSFLLPTKNAG